MSRPYWVLDTGALMAYVHGVETVGEALMEIADVEGTVAVPLRCLLEAYSLLDQTEHEYLRMLRRNPALRTVLPDLDVDRTDDAPMIGGMARHTGRLGAAHAAYTEASSARSMASAIPTRTIAARRWPPRTEGRLRAGLSITPPPGYAHAIIATRLMVWLAQGGVPADRIAQAVGLRIPGRHGGIGGRIPDLVVWSKTQTDGVWLPVDDVLLVVEIVSPGSEGVDTVTKRSEHASAGIPQYWVIDQDTAQTVTLHHLDGGCYASHATMPLAWLLNSNPAEHDLD